MELVAAVTGTHIEGNGSIAFDSVDTLVDDVVLVCICNGPETDAWPDTSYPFGPPGGVTTVLAVENAADLGLIAYWYRVTVDGPVNEAPGQFLGQTNMVGVLSVWRGPGMLDLPFAQITARSISTETSTIADQQVTSTGTVSPAAGALLINVAMVDVDNTVVGSFSEQDIDGQTSTFVSQHAVARTGSVRHISASYRVAEAAGYVDMSATYTEPTNALRILSIAINPSEECDCDETVELAADDVAAETVGDFLGTGEGEYPRDLALSGDWDLVTTRDLFVVTGLDSIGQAIGIALKTLRAEWFLDEEEGMLYYQSILVKGGDLRAIREIYRQEILRVPGVLDVTEIDISLDAATRHLSITFVASTDFGEFPGTFASERVGE